MVDGPLLTGARVFVVEDEALVALNLETMLEDLGCTVVATAMRTTQAIQHLDNGLTADVAILDVNLGGTLVFPVAERVAQAGIPILFATGYGRAGLPAEWQQTTVLQKPYSETEIARGIAAALAGATAGA